MRDPFLQKTMPQPPLNTPSGCRICCFTIQPDSQTSTNVIRQMLQPVGERPTGFMRQNQQIFYLIKHKVDAAGRTNLAARANFRLLTYQRAEDNAQNKELLINIFQA